MIELDDLAIYVLDFASFDKEPLHLIISAVWEEMQVKPEILTEKLLMLITSGYLICYRHSGLSGDSYEKLPYLTKDMLDNYIKRNKEKGFTNYPTGEEFFFQVTSKGFNKIQTGEKDNCYNKAD